MVYFIVWVVWEIFECMKINCYFVSDLYQDVESTLFYVAFKCRLPEK